MTKPKPPQWIQQTRYAPGQRWITTGRTAFELPYVAVCKEVIRILTEHQQADEPKPTLPELSERMIKAHATVGQIVTPAQVARAFRNAPRDLKNDPGRRPRRAPPEPEE